MTHNPALDPVVTRLANEFGDVLPPSMVATGVALAAPPGAAASTLAVVEATARADLVALAEATTRSATSHGAA